MFTNCYFFIEIHRVIRINTSNIHIVSGFLQKGPWFFANAIRAGKRGFKADRDDGWMMFCW